MTGYLGTLVELFRTGRPVDPTATSLLETPAGVRLTYADADRRSAQLAGALASFGVRRGDRVAVNYTIDRDTSCSRGRRHEVAIIGGADAALDVDESRPLVHWGWSVLVRGARRACER